MSHHYYITPEEYEIAAANGISRARVNHRVRGQGWKVQRAITTPPKTMTSRGKWTTLAEKNGICKSTFYDRVNKYGMSPEEAATRPIHDPVKSLHIVHQRKRDKSRKWLELAAKHGVKPDTYHKRVRSGWKPERAATTPPLSGKERAAFMPKLNLSKRA